MPKKIPTRDRTAFGQRLESARKWAKKTQTQVAAFCEISQGTYSALEREGEGSTYTAHFAHLFGVDAYWLATGKGQEPDWSKPPSRLVAGLPSLHETPDLKKLLRVLSEIQDDPVTVGKVLAYTEARREDLGEFRAPRTINGD